MRYEWRSRFGLPLTVLFDGRMTWAEGWALAEEILLDESSHLYASVRGWSFPPSDVLRVNLTLFELWANTQRKRGSLPIILKRPWEDKKTFGGASLVDAESPERLAAIARLESLGPELPAESE